jgi:hypothetical protein
MRAMCQMEAPAVIFEQIDHNIVNIHWFTPDGLSYSAGLSNVFSMRSVPAMAASK